MASKVQRDASAVDAEDLLEVVDKNLDRLKVLYEQYFLGIQKQAPAHQHHDIERKLRDLTQMQLRSTRLRYRLATIQQKYGAYNAYWRRTLRQIENGTYARALHKIGREAARTGAEVPEEILAAMPKRMREQVQRDREQALALAAKRRGDVQAETSSTDLENDAAAVIREPADVRLSLKTRAGAHVLDETNSDLDIDAFFQGVEADVPEPAPPPSASAQSPPSGRPSVAPQTIRPNPIAPGAAAARGPVHVELLKDPFLRTPSRSGRDASIAPATSGSSGRPSVAPPTVASPRPSIAPPTAAPPRPSIAPPPRPSVAPPPRPSVAPPPFAGVPRRATAAPIGSGSDVRASGSAGVPASARTGPVPSRTMTPPIPTQPRPPNRAPSHADGLANKASPQRPPPGMSDADVNALYANYVRAKQMVGDKIAPGEHGKLLKTINSQAPKIMKQYNAKAVDFSVIVKDNQVILRAKPKLKP